MALLAALSGTTAAATVASLGATFPNTMGMTGAVAALLAEILATFLLVTVILGVVRSGERANSWAGIAIGGTVALGALAFGPVSGASMNPARSFGPMLFDPEAMRVYWVYVVGPLSGGIGAMAVDRIIAGSVNRNQEGAR